LPAALELTKILSKRAFVSLNKYL